MSLHGKPWRDIIIPSDIRGVQTRRHPSRDSARATGESARPDHKDKRRRPPKICAWVPPAMRILTCLYYVGKPIACQQASSPVTGLIWAFLGIL